jgi:hypothetical protein
VLSVALPWLQANPAAREAATKRIEASGKAVPDAVLEDPSRLVDAFKEAIVQAVQADAPLGVLDELMFMTRTLSGRVSRMSPYVRQELASLQGLRDPGEITSALRESLGRATDEDTRAGIERLMAVANSIPHFLGPDGLDPFIDPTEEGITDPGPPDPGTTRPPTTEPGTTDPGTSETGTFGTGAPGSTNAAAVEVGQMLADAGAELGRQVGGGSGAPEDADTGAVLGAQYATQLGSDFGVLTDDEDSGDSPTGTASERFWGIVGGLVGGALFGPAGVAAGYLFGVSFGSTTTGTGAAQAIGSAVLAGVHAVDPGIDATILAACVLCGPTCIVCVLAAESGIP